MTPSAREALVSVIIPCYNQARYLADSVGSVREQSYRAWECIIVNDGSTDDTNEVSRRLALEDSRIRCVEKANGGLSSARNRGLDEAHGDYIQFLDADDYIRHDKFDVQLAKLTGADRVALAYCDFDACSDDGVEVQLPEYYSHVLDEAEPLSDLAWRWETTLSIPAHCFLFDAKLFTENGIRFDEELRNHEDWDCWMRVFALRPLIYFQDVKLAMYRFHEGSLSSDTPRMRDGFIAAIRSQQARFRDDPEMSRILAKKLRLTKRFYRVAALNKRCPGMKRFVPHAILSIVRKLVGTNG